MNAARRSRIEAVEAKIQDLCAELDTIIEEETEAYDNLPESLQSGERGDAMQTSIDGLQSARDDLENVGSSLAECRA